MKKIINHILFFTVILLAASGCKKEDNEVVYQGGSALTATASVTGTIPLAKLNKEAEAVSFSWTNPNYQLNTGVSSQDVSYALQMDTVNGKKFVTVGSVKADLTKTVTQGDFNDYLTKEIGVGLFLNPDVTYNIKVRIKSFLGTESETNPTNQYSNVLTFSVTPYSVDPDLWITGTAVPSNYTNQPPADQKFTYNRAAGTFSIIEAFTPGTEYKLLTVFSQWQPQYGGASANGGTLSVNPGGGTDPAGIPTPAVAGTYKLTVNLATKTLTVEKQ